jgi:hypothetical protein
MQKNRKNKAMSKSVEMNCTKITLTNGQSFKIIHDLPYSGLNNIYDAIENWKVRTKKATAQSLCDYINSKYEMTGQIAFPKSIYDEFIKQKKLGGKLPQGRGYLRRDEMKQNRYEVKFLSTDNIQIVFAFSEHEAEILARAEQIKKGNKWNGSVSVIKIEKER